MLSIVWSEFKIQIKSWPFYIVALLSLLFGVFVINKQTPDMDIEVSGSYFLVKSFAIQLLILPIIASIFSARASIRDYEFNIYSLVYAGCNKLSVIFIARLLAFISVVWLVYLSFALGILLGLTTSESENSITAIQTIVWSLSFIAFPNIVLICAMLFLVGIFSRKSIFIYIVAIACFFLYQLFLTINGSPLMASRVFPSTSMLEIYALLDPMGLSGYFESVRNWKPFQKNTNLPPFSEALIINRIAILFITSVVTWKAIQKNTSSARIDNAKLLSPWFDKFFSFNAFSRIKVLNLNWVTAKPLVIAIMELSIIVRSKAFWIMIISLVLFVASEVHFGFQSLESLGVQAIPSTIVALERFTTNLILPFTTLFILIIVTDVFWQSRSNNFSSILDAAPFSNTEQFVGRTIAIFCVAVTFVLACLFSSVFIQLLNAGNIKLTVYVELFAYVLIRVCWFAGIAAVIHSLFTNKYIALGTTIFLYLLCETNLLVSFGLEHPFWTLGQLPEIIYSDITGFGGQLNAFWGYMLFRYSILSVLIFIAILYMRRGEELTEVMSFSVLKKQGLIMRALVVTSTMLVIISFGNVFQKTFVIGNYQSSSDKHSWKAAYEIQYKDFKKASSLQPKKVVSKVHLDSNNSSLTIDVKYELVNNSNKPINKLLFTTPKPFLFSNVKVENATQHNYNAEFESHIYHLLEPLLPGETTQMSLKANYTSNSYLGLLSDLHINKSMTYIRFLRFLPQFGYVEHYELKNNGLRESFGLAPRVKDSLIHEIASKPVASPSLYKWAEMDTTIATRRGLSVVAPGKRVTTWYEGEKQFTRFVTDRPIRDFNHIAIMQLPHISSKVNDINIEVYFPNGKDNYAQLHLQAIKDTIQYGVQSFGKLNVTDIRLVPAPNFFPSTGYALPYTLFIGEKVGFHVNLDNENGFDHLYRRTVHEMSHQWWGHGIQPASVEGEGVLNETLAKYTEMMLLEKKYGNEYVKRLVKYEYARYLQAKSHSDMIEVPLYRADEKHLIYSKGAVAMYTLKEALGEEHINQALALLVKRHSYPYKPATTLDLVHYLKLNANNEKKQLIDYWFTQVNDITINF